MIEINLSNAFAILFFCLWVNEFFSARKFKHMVIETIKEVGREVVREMTDYNTYGIGDDT